MFSEAKYFTKGQKICIISLTEDGGQRGFVLLIATFKSTDILHSEEGAIFLISALDLIDWWTLNF